MLIIIMGKDWKIIIMGKLYIVKHSLSEILNNVTTYSVPRSSFTPYFSCRTLVKLALKNTQMNVVKKGFIVVPNINDDIAYIATPIVAPAITKGKFFIELFINYCLVVLRQKYHFHL